MCLPADLGQGIRPRSFCCKLSLNLLLLHRGKYSASSSESYHSPVNTSDRLNQESESQHHHWQRFGLRPALASTTHLSPLGDTVNVMCTVDIVKYSCFSRDTNGKEIPHERRTTKTCGEAHKQNHFTTTMAPKAVDRQCPDCASASASAREQRRLLETAIATTQQNRQQVIPGSSTQQPPSGSTSQQVKPATGSAVSVPQVQQQAQGQNLPSQRPPINLEPRANLGRSFLNP